MLNNEVVFREIKPEDYPALEKIISDTWGYEKFSSPPLAKQLTKLYLQSCLAVQSFNKVAVYQEKAVGIIMAKSNHAYRPSFKQNLKTLKIAWPLLFKKESRKLAKLFWKFEKTDQALLAECGEKFQGELVFFAVDQNVRGLGIGKALFSQAQAYLKSENIPQFYLYTDSTCNYQFYEHQGLERIGEKAFSLAPHHLGEILFYLYRYQFPKGH